MKEPPLSSLRGFVTLHVSGPQVEKFINAVTGAGIIIWDVRPAGDGASLNLLLDDFFGFARSSKRQAAVCMLQPGTDFRFASRACGDGSFLPQVC